MIDEMKILFVDDDENLLEQAVVYFKDEDIDLVTVGSSEKAFDMLKKDDFDAIVCDYKMPEMDGLELLEKIRTNGFDVPFIIFTGQGREEVAMKALNLGADRYIQKGGDPSIQYGVLADAIRQEVIHWKTEKELTSTEKKYKDLSEKSLVGVYVIQNDLFRYVNPEFCNIFGYDRDEVLNKDYRELVSRDDLERVESGVSRREEGEGESVRYEFKALTKDDEKIDVEVFSVPSSYQGKPAVQGTLIDVTENKKREKKLKENKEKIERLHEISRRMIDFDDKQKVYDFTVEVAENILDFDICSIDIVEDGMLRVKATSEETPPDSSFDSPADEGIGGRSFQENQSFLIDDVGSQSDAEPKNLDFKSGISVPIEDYGVFQAVSYEREYFDEEDIRMTNLLVSQTRLALNSIEKEEEIKEKRDKITSLHKAALDLKDIEDIQEVYDKIVEIAKEILDFHVCGVIIKEDGKGTVKSASEDVPEYGREGSSIEKGVTGHVYQKGESLLIKDVEEFDVDQKLSEYRSGITIPILENGVFQALSKDKNGFDEEDLEMAELLIAHMEDAIKRIRSEDIQKFLVTLLRHDMKNKMRVVDGYLDLLKDSDISDESMDIIGKAKKACKKNIEFIDKLGLLKDIHQEKEGSEYRLDRALKKVLSKMEDELEEEGVELNYEPRETKVTGGGLLEDLFFNLIENSIKHSDCDNIEVSVREDGKDVLVDVEDDGEGISDDILEEVFNKGIKGEESSGTGIGLYLVKKIAELYGGTIRVEKMDPKGTRFTVELKKA